MGAESIMKFEKLKELLVLLEKPRHWIQVGAPFLILGLVLVVFYYCFCGSCRGRRGAKMMKAPGRDYRMARPLFESNPRGYFRGLRADRIHFR
ncbi:hypothetical protein PVL29_000003 [Vitis rotundifolia]|uniref:Transmembrane protein n=1 Tax=Vitis rotundifolia TaxID=103349 RepID=A0AA39AHG5_VITRO|nr:hypothetical protein PVL29_000003 [Vitis rotundifolia]